MKTLLLAALVALSLVTESACQVIGYYLPEKKLRITVTYNLKGYVLQGMSTGDREDIRDRKFEIVISDDVKVEEIVVPDRNRLFEMSFPSQLAKGGARFDWAFKLDRNGILAGWNASREPIGAVVLSGGIGLITNILTGLTQLQGIRPGLTETSYKVSTEQEITVTEIVDIPPGGISEKVVAIPQLDTAVANALTILPSVSVTITDTGTGSEVAADEVNKRRDVLYYIAPRYYHLVVTVHQNGLLDKGRVIDHLFVVPQHGQLKHIAPSELFKGRRSAAISLDPSTGQLISWQYKRDGNTKAELTEINKQLESLSEAISAFRTMQDQKLKQEVTRLELEVRKLELLQRRQE
jgi:hypothetical protein